MLFTVTKNKKQQIFNSPKCILLQAVERIHLWLNMELYTTILHCNAKFIKNRVSQKLN